VGVYFSGFSSETDPGQGHHGIRVVQFNGLVIQHHREVNLLVSAYASAVEEASLQTAEAQPPFEVYLMVCEFPAFLS